MLLNFQGEILRQGTSLYEKISQLSQAQMNEWAKSSKLDFAPKAGLRTLPIGDGTEMGFFSNSALKIPAPIKWTTHKDGRVKGFKFDRDIVLEGNNDSADYLKIMGQQAIVQMFVFNLASEFYRAPERELVEKTQKYRNVPKTGSKNQTPYGVACVKLFKLLGVESEMKWVPTKYEEEEGSKKFSYTGELGLEQINKPQSEAQKNALTKGQTSGARGGVKKGKSQKTKQLESHLHACEQKIKKMTEYLHYIRKDEIDFGNLTAEDEKFYAEVVKETEEGTIQAECGLGEVETKYDLESHKTRHSDETIRLHVGPPRGGPEADEIVPHKEEEPTALAKQNLMADMMEDSEAEDEESTQDVEEEEDSDTLAQIESTSEVVEEFDLYKETTDIAEWRDEKPGWYSAPVPSFNAFYKHYRAEWKKHVGGDQAYKAISKAEKEETMKGQMEEWLKKMGRFHKAELVDLEGLIEEWEGVYQNRFGEGEDSDEE